MKTGLHRSLIVRGRSSRRATFLVKLAGGSLHPDARTNVTIAVRIAAGSPGHASTIAANSGSVRKCGASASWPPLPESP